MTSTTPMAPPAGTAEAQPPRPRVARWTPRFERVLLRCTGTALALAAAGTGAAGSGGVADRFGPAAPVAVAALALWAAPGPDGPPKRPASWPARLTAARTTLLATGSVLLAAVGEPPLWQALAVTVLLVGYLLLLDALGPRRRTVRPASAAAAVTASLLVLPVAFAPTAAGEWSRPIALLGLAAAGWGVALALRPPRPAADDAGAHTGTYSDEAAARH